MAQSRLQRIYTKIEDFYDVEVDDEVEEEEVK